MNDKRILKLARTAFIGLLCLAGAVAVVNALARVEFKGEGLDFASQIKLLVPGETRLSLPPLGVASAATHSAPVSVTLELRGLTPSILQDLGSDSVSREKVLAGIENQAKTATLKTALLAVFLAGLGSLLVLILFRRVRVIVMLGAFALGSVFCTGLIAWTYFDFNVEALRQPRYEGMLESASWVMAMLSDSLQGFERLGQGFEVMAKNLPYLTRGQTGAPMSDIGEDLRVLHISDIHNNKAAMDLVDSLVKNFAIDFVIDTGDLTDFGTAFETSITSDIGRLQVPYVFVPGNHDSPEVVASLHKEKNVIVADGKIVKVEGLRILGLPDPSSASFSMTVVDEDEKAAGEKLAQLWQEAQVKPDIVAVHNGLMLDGLIGKAPVVMHGHDHQASLSISDGTVIEDAGTTGAAGLRGLTSQNEIPYTVSIQYWDKSDGPPRLLAVDSISVGNLDGTLHVKRTVIGQDNGTEAAAIAGAGD